MSGTWVGIDAGASGTKVVARRGERGVEREARRLASDDDAELERWVRQLEPDGIGTTGAGGARWAERLGGRFPTRFQDEFQAWADGSDLLLEGHEIPIERPYLVASVGTGTSVIRVSEGPAERAGGCALGGGTLRGLGQLLLGTSDHDEISTLAAKGNRFGIDLEIADLYPEIPRGFTASNFGGNDLTPARTKNREDLAQALAVMVGENVSILCCALANGRGIHHIAFGGGTLRNNPACWEIIEQMARVRGHTAIALPDGEYTGAEGAVLAAMRGATD